MSKNSDASSLASSLTSSPCPCCSEKLYKSCCEPFLSQKKVPQTPEELMRSRYTAFVVKNMEYVKQTTDLQIRSRIDFEANEKWANEAQFLKLEIISADEDGNKGTVEFKASFKIENEEDIQIHHEFSKFRKQAGVWYFREGRSLNKE